MWHKKLVKGRRETHEIWRREMDSNPLLNVNASRYRARLAMFVHVTQW
jgi:hypothetical protein